MSSARKALAQWVRHIERAGAGASFEVGLVYDPESGWRVYQRIGDKGLALSPQHARGIAEAYDQISRRPEWRNVAHGLDDTLGALRLLADEAEQKNRNKVIPDGYAAMAPAQGRA
jgi:hypothetical protein